MADSGHHRKRTRYQKFSFKRLLKDDNVEVRSIEEGFLGSWHAGVITESWSRVRVVKYDHLLTDDGRGLLIEPVEVSSMVDGNYGSSEASNNYRPRIRPFPPVRELTREKLYYGLCVDAYYMDSWWEGVIFDGKNGSDNRKVFFPDLGDEMNVSIENLRITHDWDEVSAEWNPRGSWLFLEFVEEKRMDNVIPVSVKQIWYDLRLRKEYNQIGHWGSPVKPLLQKLVEDILDDHMSLTLGAFMSAYMFSETVPEHGKQICLHESLLAIVPSSSYYKSAVTPEDISPLDGELVTENEKCMTVFDEIVENETLGIYSLDVSPNSGVALSSNALIMPVQPEALSIICCNQKGSETPCSGSNGKPTRKLISRSKFDSDENYLHSKYKLNWQPVGGELNIKPEFCPQSINEYLLLKRPGSRLTRDVRNHLKFLGWKMDYTKTLGQLRIRYISPQGLNFYNVRAACEYFISVPQNSSTVEHSQRNSSSSSDNVNSFSLQPQMRFGKTRRKNRPRLSSKMTVVDVVPQYCPDSVNRYLECHNSNSKIGRTEFCVKVRKHLSALGWAFWCRTRDGKEEWRYCSPCTDKMYNSLISVCKAFAEGEESNTCVTSGGEASSFNTEVWQPSLPQRSKKCDLLRKQRAGGIKKHHKKKKNGFISSLCFSLRLKEPDQKLEDDGFKSGLKKGGKQWSVKKLSSRFLSKKRKALGKVRSTSDGNDMTQQLQSSKRIRLAGLSCSSQVPRTVLSWLIDNKVISAKKKVFYHSKKDLPPIAEGKITREGIRCRCCKKIFTLSAFEAHAGSSSCQPAANLFLKDGRSLVDCQMEIISKNARRMLGEPLEITGEKKCQSWNDHICSICRYGGELILCDLCPSSFHKDCLSLQKIPEGDWFCPSCCCGVCGESQFDLNAEQFSDQSVLCCQQCEKQYHAQCVRNREAVKLDVHPTEKWFCSKTCEKVHWGLQQLLGKPILVGQNNLTWTLIKPMHYGAREHDDCDIATMAENNSKLYVALEVMHECFEPVKEPRTGRDIVEDVIFCRSSDLNRLNFRGFYTVLLERNDELLTVTSLRVYGNKVAEIPLIGTRFLHRRLGMCRIMMNEIEKVLFDLGVDKLVLPAAPSVLNTWTTSFGFSPVTQSDRSEFMGYTFLDFQDTVMCQKVLRKHSSPLSYTSRNKPGDQHEPRQIMEGSNGLLDLQGNSGISEVFQEEQLEGSETVDQGVKVIDSEDQHNGGDCSLECPVPMSINHESEPCGTLELMDQKKADREKCDGNLKFYKRKKAIELRSSLPQADYPKVEVSCR